jgi:hypothetical protein
LAQALHSSVAFTVLFISLSGSIPDPLEDFLRKYQALADARQLIEQLKVEIIIRYVSAGLRDWTIESL